MSTCNGSLSRATSRRWGRLPLRLTKRQQAGFTLIEILIVAALIALLAGIAVINIQRAYVDNQRKATYGECYNISTALQFAFDDVQVYPKLCFLSENVLFIAPPTPTNLTQPGPFVLSGFEYIGHDVNVPSTIAARIVKNWAQGLGSGGYFSAPSGRRGLFQGRRGGVINMEIPTQIYQNVVSPLDRALPIYSWPADPWGRPYVVYLINQRGVLPDGRPDVYFPTHYARRDDEVVYTRAVVSYGPNGFPGGGVDWTTDDVLFGQSLALYDRDTRQYPAESDYRALMPDEYNQPVSGTTRYEAWNFEKLNPAIFQQGRIGVVDPGSDDVVREF